MAVALDVGRASTMVGAPLQALAASLVGADPGWAAALAEPAPDPEMLC
jgi:hypothetical protein